MLTPNHKLLLRWALVPAMLIIAVACGKKDDGKPDDGPNLPQSSVPAEMIGQYWHAGSFSMTQFSNYDGSYAGQAFEISTGYKFAADGTAEQYFYWTKTTTYCREQVLGYRKGTAVFDAEKKTFRFYAASGYYRRYNSCGGSQSPGYGQRVNYGPEDLHPKYVDEMKNWQLVTENGKRIWRIPYSDGSVNDFTRAEEPR
ncbi:hypothetical protein [Chitinophaga rhizosphaerae]|uniref:hypothetical protein n=1 Tax=Chitinophaga rhizosphaerae TaxID=1864947 RepID=UPI000F7FBAA0|nr:hypothetical protein [Chitinophaga rhizosphaerae]